MRHEVARKTTLAPFHREVTTAYSKFEMASLGRDGWSVLCENGSDDKPSWQMYRPVSDGA